MPEAVRTKPDFVRRFLKGEFGNKTYNWDTLDEFKAANFRGLVHIRNRVAAGASWYDVPSSQVPQRWKQLVKDPKQHFLASMAPTSKTLFQGEVMQTHEGLYLYYSTLALPMRYALAQQAHTTTGIITSTLLRHYLDANSYDWLQYLLDAYPEHVIEFSTYSERCGTLAWNTLFWEVRNY